MRKGCPASFSLLVSQSFFYLLFSSNFMVRTVYVCVSSELFHFFWRVIQWWQSINPVRSIFNIDCHVLTINERFSWCLFGTIIVSDSFFFNQSMLRLCVRINKMTFIISKDKNEDTKLIYREFNRQNNNNNIISRRNLMLVYTMINRKRKRDRHTIDRLHQCLIIIEIEKREKIGGSIFALWNHCNVVHHYSSMVRYF